VTGKSLAATLGAIMLLAAGCSGDGHAAVRTTRGSTVVLALTRLTFEATRCRGGFPSTDGSRRMGVSIDG
jgi:hypothetical protein